MPGPDEEAAAWLAAHRPRVVGSDTTAFEHIPAGEGHARLPGHRVLLGLFGLAFVAVFALAWRRRITVEAASAWAMVALLALSPVILVWYIVLALALAAISPERGIRPATFALTAAFVALTPARHLIGL